jgi:hypothetical protein
MDRKKKILTSGSHLSSVSCALLSYPVLTDRKCFLLQGDHNHLFIRQGTGLQGQAVFRTKLTFRPHSTESFTHRKMTLSLADRSQKTSGIKVLSQVGWDPEQNRGQMIKVRFSSVCTTTPTVPVFQLSVITYFMLFVLFKLEWSVSWIHFYDGFFA